MAQYTVMQLDGLDAVACPCGMSRRAFAIDGNNVATIHLVDIEETARTHYHKKMTEIYVILDGEGHLELDGEPIPVKPLTAVLIKPGCRHRAVGQLRVLNVVVPPFDPDDEYFD
jgi:mannose-6-phosphate isomerase-like protein (cupin superfamily)